MHLSYAHGSQSTLMELQVLLPQSWMNFSMEKTPDKHLDLAAEHLKELIFVVREGFNDMRNGFNDMRDGFRENSASMKEISAKRDDLIYASKMPGRR